MLSFANASKNTKLVNRPKCRFLLNFVGTKGVRWKFYIQHKYQHAKNIRVILGFLKMSAIKVTLRFEPPYTEQSYYREQRKRAERLIFS